MKRLDLFNSEKPRPSSQRSGSSLRGNQAKAYDPETRRYVKYDFSATSLQGLTECFIALVLDHVTVDSVPVDHASYTPFIDGELRGAVTPNFVLLGEREVTSHRILSYSAMDGKTIDNTASVATQIEQYISICEEYTGLSGFAKYFGVQLLLDAVFFNEDRHFSNISFIRDANKKYRFAPYFDFAESYRFYQLGGVEHSVLTFEPQPFMREQLECLDSLLGSTRIQFNLNSWNHEFSVRSQKWECAYEAEEICILKAMFLSALSTPIHGGKFEVV